MVSHFHFLSKLKVLRSTVPTSTVWSACNPRTVNPPVHNRSVFPSPFASVSEAVTPASFMCFLTGRLELYLGRLRGEADDRGGGGRQLHTEHKLIVIDSSKLAQWRHIDHGLDSRQPILVCVRMVIQMFKRLFSVPRGMLRFRIESFRANGLKL